MEEARGGSWLSSGMGVHGEHSPRQALGKPPHLLSPSQASPPTYLEERSGGEGEGARCAPLGKSLEAGGEWGKGWGRELAKCWAWEHMPRQGSTPLGRP